MPNMYNPDTKEGVTVEGDKAVKDHEDRGFVWVGDADSEEYEGKNRDELGSFDKEEDEDHVDRSRYVSEPGTRAMPTEKEVEAEKKHNEDPTKKSDKKDK